VTDPSPRPASLAAVRDAVLHGREPPPLQAVARLASYRWFVVGTVCVGAVMGQIDASMTQMLLPRLEADFSAPLSTVSWVAVAYILAMASFMPVFGRLADMVGRKLLYITGFLVFVLGSGLCGFATNLPELIGFRVLQAIGAALMTANSVAIIVLATNPQERGRGLGLQSAAQAVGLGAGPALGGLILDTLGWHWAFWINVPVGLFGAVLGWFVIPQTKGLHSGEHFDWTGALLIAPALTALVALLNEGHAWGATSPAFIGCLGLAIVFLVLFVLTERRARSPLIDFQLLGKGAFLVGNIANFLSYATLFGVFFVVPFVLVRVYDDSALATGLRLSIVPVMLGLLAPVGGALYDRIGPRAVTACGMAVCIAGLAVLHFCLDGTAGDLTYVILALAIFGVGQGLFISPNSGAIMATVPAAMTGEAGSLLNMMRNLGMSTGIAAASTLLALRLSALTGNAGATISAPPATLLAASRDVLLLLAGFAALAGVLSLLRSQPGANPGATGVVPE
jgi:EmrB/QacA subfamily drug resistance transporter